ncbi:MAG: chalcone isomerase family protein [Steroidobacteraceae bacterium]
MRFILPHRTPKTRDRQGFARLASLLAATGLWLFSGMPALAATASDLPAIVRSEGFELAPVGGDELSLYGFRVYHASLWAPSGRYEPARTHALSLHYRRGFTKQRLVDITLSAWGKAGVGSEAQRKAWADRLLQIWHDVGKDDILAAVVVPGRETRFYNASGLLGRIEDKDFGPAYLGIWLDEKTLLPALRTSLLGLKRTS